MKMKRIESGQTIKDASKQLNISQHNLYLIEEGKRNGSFYFWVNYQTTYKISDEEMWNIIKGE